MSFTINKHRVCTIDKIGCIGHQTLLHTVGDIKFEILSVGMQEDSIVMWVKASESNPGMYCTNDDISNLCKIKRTEVMVYKTGEYIYDDLYKFIGTVISKDGVEFHVFQGKTF